MIDRTHLSELLAQEDTLFEQRHPRSRELFARAQAHLLGGVPMNWMVRWAGRFPVFVEQGQGAHFVDVDGRRYLDLCLGDTAAMTARAGPAWANIGQAVCPALPGRVWEFNDLPALEGARAPGEVASVLAAPAMTNIGIIHPEPGFHAALRELTRRTGTLLILDETHTI